MLQPAVLPHSSVLLWLVQSLGILPLLVSMPLPRSLCINAPQYTKGNRFMPAPLPSLCISLGGWGGGAGGRGGLVVASELSPPEPLLCNSNCSRNGFVTTSCCSQALSLNYQPLV